MITYTWKVTSVRTATVAEQSNFIVNVRWEKTGTDEAGNTGTFVGATPLATTVDTAGNFVPFSELTEEMIVSWIQPVVVGSYEQHVNRQIQEQIDAKVNVVAEPALPWAPPPPPLPGDNDAPNA